MVLKIFTIDRYYSILSPAPAMLYKDLKNYYYSPTSPRYFNFSAPFR